MARDTHSTHKVALLATGDELSQGDILNSNASDIAKKLFTLGINIGIHAVTADNTLEIENAIAFLLKHHDALIITGGLGPTSDDITRYALSNACKCSLVFDQATWDAIVARLKNFGYATPPESNRQQALFPESATIIENPNGTAAGCMLEQDGKIIFMLPGPPLECLSMVDSVVIPTLTAKKFSRKYFYHSWLLFGVSEGQIAEELDQLAKPFQCTTGYRLAYPYLEFKIRSENQEDFEKLFHLAEQHISPYLISDGIQPASEALKTLLTNGEHSLHICDKATGGLLESTLTTPMNRKNLCFTCEHHTTLDVPIFSVTGLNELWEQKPNAIQTKIILDYRFQNQHKKIEKIIPFRGDRVKKYAVEWLSYRMMRQIDVNADNNFDQD